MTNPFEDENGTYHVLVNEEGQHSLWPHFIEVPAGWRIVHEADSRAGCMAYVAKNWTDLRPASLIKQMNAVPQNQVEHAVDLLPGAASQKLH